MSNQYTSEWERQLAETASRFSYPPTPDVAARVWQHREQRVVRVTNVRRLASAALVLLLLGTALLAVPAVRAAVRDFLQLGAIRILPDTSTATPAPQDTVTVYPGAAALDGTPLTGPSTRGSTHSLTDLAGATTWDAAQADAGFPLRLPAYPPGLGPPDAVYRQQLWDPGIDAPVVILLWYEDEQPEEVALALYQIALPYYGIKGASLSAIMETEVHGEGAYWVEGPHRLQLNSDTVEEWLFVPGSVLIWVEGAVTYRLEGAATVDEAVRIAESLQPGLEGGP